MEILQLLNELEEMGERGEKHWMCRVILLRKLVLDADEFFDMLHKLRTSLPEEMTTATQLTKQRQEIIAAQQEAQKIIDGARSQRSYLQRRTDEAGAGRGATDHRAGAGRCQLHPGGCHPVGPRHRRAARELRRPHVGHH